VRPQSHTCRTHSSNRSTQGIQFWIVLDIGAHAGFHSVFCALLVGDTAECSPLNPIQFLAIARGSLEVQIRLNRTLHLDVIPYALSGKIQGRDEDFRQLVGLELPIPDVIKIDVESERESPSRFLKTLSKFRPIVLCDYNDDKTLSIVSGIFLPLDYEFYLVLR